MRVVHLYPFVPRGRHGGTLRLNAAIDASATVGEPEVHYFDRDAGAWRGPVDRSALERLATELDSDAAPTASLKRRLLPSTLWESGFRARRAIGGHLDRLEIDAATVVFVHTTYLAGLLRDLAPVAGASVVDVYDLVWRAHRNDAGAAHLPAAAVRAAYALSVRGREEGAARRADAVLVAGYEDHSVLAARIPTARWVPTATPVVAVPAPGRSDGLLRAGVLGNFAHVSTRRAAERVVHSSLAEDPGTRLVFAGLHSRGAIPPGPGVEVLGAVGRVEDFYARIDCVIAPVELGSGLKVKLGEALLAGRPVVTSPLGAAGFPPAIRRHFTVCDPARLEAEVARRAVAEFDSRPAREAAERELGYLSVVDRYAAALRELAPGDRS